MKANSLSSKSTVVNLLPTARSAPFFVGGLKQLDISLLTETALVTIASISVIKFLNETSITPAPWLVVPCIWVTAAIIPSALKGRKFPEFGLNIKQLKHTLWTLCWVSVLVFSALWFGLSLLRFCGLPFPLRPAPPQYHDWFSRLFYQFMYIAVAEEVFFRGYVQDNILRLTNKDCRGHQRLHQWLSICISAGCFAAAHIIVQGQIISALTFLPALICAWLFVRTKVLLAPILFHGLANTCYCILAAVLA